MTRSAVIGLLFLVVACTDATSDVGINLLEDEAKPEVLQIPPTVFEEIPLRDVTGSLQRVLAGHVVDHLTGTIRVTGYADFSGGFNAADETPITGVNLRLVRNYVFGDTMQAVTVDIHDILDGWEAPGGKADTTLELGPRIASFTFLPTDTLVVVPLPESWIDLHLEALRSTEFDAVFHGLALTGNSETSVIGFAIEGSDLLVTTESGTSTYNLSRSISRIERLGPDSVPEGRVLLQDGSGPSVRVSFDLEAFSERPINGATVRFFADRLESQLAPAHFVRPPLETLQLLMVKVPGEAPTLITELSLSDQNDYSASSASLGLFFQDVFFGVHEYAYLELRIPVPENTISSVLLHDATAGVRAPEALFVFSR